MLSKQCRGIDTMAKYRTYLELSRLETFEERFNYLKLSGTPSYITFGGHRQLNQMLYKSPIWRNDVRPRVILRDNGCDLGIDDRPIMKGDILIIHHINPITIEDVVNNNPCVYDLNNLICCTDRTHKQIHYGDGSNLIPSEPIERRPGDTKLW